MTASAPLAGAAPRGPTLGPMRRAAVRWRRARRRTGPRDFLALAAILGAFGAAGLGWVRSGLLLNHTASLPEGLYRVTRRDPAAPAPLAQVARGQVVVWCLPRVLSDAARARGYLVRGRCPAGGEPLLKFVAALPGDTVDVDARGLTVNGHLLANSRAEPLDTRGRPVAAVARGRYVVPPGSAWLWSPYSSRSYDSRYYGPLRAADMVGTARPVWTARRELPAGPHGGLTPAALGSAPARGAGPGAPSAPPASAR